MAVTGDAVIAAIFLAPVVLFAVIAAAAAGGSGDWSIVGVMTAIGLAASALILGVTRLLMALIHREHPARFAAFAAALGGQVRQNLLGERQLRVPHPRGRVELDFRYSGGDADQVGDRFTRVALVLDADGLPGERHRLAEGTGDARLTNAARAEIAALRAAFGARARVHLEGRRRPQSVEVWLPAWLADGDAARRAVTLALPHLEALASAPWSA